MQVTSNLTGTEAQDMTAPGVSVLGDSYSKPFTAEKILIGTGTTPARRPDFDFDGVHIIDRCDPLAIYVDEIGVRESHSWWLDNRMGARKWLFPIVRQPGGARRARWKR